MGVAPKTSTCEKFLMMSIVTQLVLLLSLLVREYAHKYLK
ncbi:hypothetical protein HMPREF0299_7662 [Corynebacterium matruchotii ATCC 14266]|uniref:Uncharacterized protein n=1 Tax=Corynebacterium matruchotii ATCC 14266 TaxID=553207 RepID=E0DDZ4_9CORY|nr:hypothetical protein HMPREF0299_7662 [Corynebacterium matruchotii ATCC 14266]